MNHHDYDILQNFQPKHADDMNQGFPFLNAQNVLSCDNGSSSSTTPSINSEQSSNNDTTPSDRRSRILEKNRRAGKSIIMRNCALFFSNSKNWPAARCRQRKKLWIEELTRQHEQSKLHNDQLHELIPRLREEVYALKSQLLSHEG